MISEYRYNPKIPVLTFEKPDKTQTRILEDLNTHTPKLLRFRFLRVLKTLSFRIGLPTLLVSYVSEIPIGSSLNLKPQ